MLIAVWVFALGGAVGSFLNVVVYRLPAGRSIVFPGSFCPKCTHPIRWYDNVPILAWIFLGGRCRDCGEPISPRYPLVEATSACIFLTLAWVEFFGGGANLPWRLTAISDELIYRPPGIGQLAGLLGWHLLLLLTLLAAALIEYDGHRPPWRLFAPGLVAGLLAPIVWPHLHPVPVSMGAGGPLSGLLDGLAGLVVGASAPLVGWCLIARRERFGLSVASASVGLFLGWQAALVLAVVAVTLYGLCRVLSRAWPAVTRISPTAYLACVTLIWILCWETIVRQWPLLAV
jgi:leader peptidase (prepilin peptidase)/N-methyltransferase